MRVDDGHDCTGQRPMPTGYVDLDLSHSKLAEIRRGNQGGARFVALNKLLCVSYRQLRISGIEVLLPLRHQSWPKRWIERLCRTDEYGTVPSLDSCSMSSDRLSR